MSFPQGNRSKQTLTHLIDVIKNHKGDFNFDDVAALLKQRSFSDLPSVLKPKKAIAHGYVMNMNIIQTSDGLFDIIQNYMFDSQDPHAVAFQIAQGQPLLIEFPSNKKVGAKPFIYMMQRLGGFAASFARLKWEIKTTKKNMLEKPEDIDAGYDFLDAACPRANDKNQQARWIDKQLNDPDSKVYG